MNDIQAVFDTAWRHHQAGNLAQAEPLYRQVLQADPRHAEAWHLLGVLAGQMGRNDVAVTCLREAVRLKPDLADAHNNLGFTLVKQGDIDQAMASYQNALRVKPDFAEAHNSLGLLLSQQGKHEEALSHYLEAVRLKPNFADAWCNAGNAQQETKRFAEALASYQRAVQLRPDHAEAQNNLGLMLLRSNRIEEATACLQTALRLRPGYPEALNHLGLVCLRRGTLDQAAGCFQQAVQCQPAYFEAWSNLGDVLRALGNVDQALAGLRQALSLRPNQAVLYNKIGILLKEQGNLDDAITHMREAIRLQPDFVDAYNNLGSLYKEQARLDEAIETFRAGMRLKPVPAYHSNLLYDLSFHPGYDAKAIFEEARRWNQQHAEPLRRFVKPWSNEFNPERRLRVGYISADFRSHCQALFTMPLLANHDHQQFEIFCYSDVAFPDVLTQRLRGYADDWRSTAGLSDEDVADMIRADRIDILVNLTMHMAQNRLLVFARKPAPIQVSWLAYPGTTGVWAIDYRLTDPYLDPPGLDDAFYSETSIRLPDTFWCYDPLGTQPEVNDLPATGGIPFTFGCLNNFCKVNDGSLELWASVLRDVPGSRLLLLAPSGWARDYVLSRFRQHQIDPERVHFSAWLPRFEYLRLYHHIDLSLDPVPYNGHTTSLDGCWMGVPTVTLIGKTVVGRAGWSQLCNLGLKELAATTREEYVQIAGEWASDPSRLRQLRTSLRQPDGGFAVDECQAFRQKHGERFSEDVAEAMHTLRRL